MVVKWFAIKNELANAFSSSFEFVLVLEDSILVYQLAHLSVGCRTLIYIEGYRPNGDK